MKELSEEEVMRYGIRPLVACTGPQTRRAQVLLGFTALPASAASTAVATTAHSSAQAVADVWVLYGSYPTPKACQLQGLRIGEYKCVGVTNGGSLVWDLYIDTSI